MEAGGTSSLNSPRLAAVQYSVKKKMSLNVLCEMRYVKRRNDVSKLEHAKIDPYISAD